MLPVYKKYLAFLVLVLFTSQSVIAADSSKKSHHIPKTRDDVFKNSPYKPSKLLLNIDFEDEVVKPQIGKKGNYDRLVLQTPEGQPSTAIILYEGGGKSDRFAKIVQDPTDSENHVFHYWLKNARIPDQKKGKFKGRIQMNLVNANKRTSVFQRFRLYLHPDLNLYKQYPTANGWFMINEFMMGARWEKHPYPFRLSLNIAKPAGVDKPLYFVVITGVANGGKIGRGKWRDIFGEVGKNFEVPVGEWLDIELGYKQGDKKSGRFYLGVKRAKDKKFTTVFDITDWTYHPDSPEPVPMTHWHPLKVYTSEKIINHVRKKGGVVQMYWDDLEIYENW